MVVDTKIYKSWNPSFIPWMNIWNFKQTKNAMPFKNTPTMQISIYRCNKICVSTKWEKWVPAKYFYYTTISCALFNYPPLLEITDLFTVCIVLSSTE